MPDQFVMFTNRAGETVKVKARGKHYIEPRGYAAPPGTGPEGKTCRQCAHYVACGTRSKSFAKCGKNEARWTHGRGSDILAGSPACSYFTEPAPAPNASPLDRWTLADGQTCWIIDDKCPDCGEAMATDGRATWCHAGCAGVVETIGVSDAEVEAIRRSVTAGGEVQ